MIQKRTKLLNLVMLIILTVTYPLSTVSAATYYVTVNPSNTVRTNVFTPGFQLDDDINRWPASSTLQQLILV